MEPNKFDEMMREAITREAGSQKSWSITIDTAEQAFSQLYDSLAKTAVDPHVQIYASLQVDGMVITHAMGSVPVVCNALVDGLHYIAPFLVGSSYVRLDLCPSGYRETVEEMKQRMQVR